ncbi:hypothetical protein [Caulobacter sp. LARHSG274]
MDEKQTATALATLASAIASVSRSVIAMQKGDSRTASEQIQICVGLLADFQDLQDQVLGNDKVKTS